MAEAKTFLLLMDKRSLSVSLSWSLAIKPSWNWPIKFCATGDGKLYRANITTMCPPPINRASEVLTLSH